MQINDNGLELIKEFEGCKLTAYQDIVGVWTIGYGETNGVKPGMSVTQAQADQMLLDRLVQFEKGVSDLTHVPLTDNQFSALVCLSYNIGLGNFKSSTLLKVLNDGKMAEAAEEFLKWDRAGGKEVSGLLRRRQAEHALFLLA